MLACFGSSPNPRSTIVGRINFVHKCNSVNLRNIKVNTRTNPFLVSSKMPTAPIAIVLSIHPPGATKNLRARLPNNIKKENLIHRLVCIFLNYCINNSYDASYIFRYVPGKKNYSLLYLNSKS